MHINNLPAELFSEILEYIPLKDASAIMQVNRQQYRKYRGIIYIWFDAKLEELLYSHWSDWNIPLRLVVYFNWHDFLLDKLNSFCKNFNRHFIKRRLHYIYDSLRIDMVDIDKEKEVIENLLMPFYKKLVLLISIYKYNSHFNIFYNFYILKCGCVV